MDPEMMKFASEMMNKMTPEQVCISTYTEPPSWLFLNIHLITAATSPCRILSFSYSFFLPSPTDGCHAATSIFYGSCPNAASHEHVSRHVS
jgi:hypothetical protein